MLMQLRSVPCFGKCFILVIRVRNVLSVIWWRWFTLVFGCSKTHLNHEVKLHHLRSNKLIKTDWIMSCGLPLSRCKHLCCSPGSTMDTQLSPLVGLGTFSSCLQPVKGHAGRQRIKVKKMWGSLSRSSFNTARKKATCKAQMFFSWLGLSRVRWDLGNVLSCTVKWICSDYSIGVW